MTDFILNQYGNIASVLGLLLSIVGFVVTIRQVFKARSAAQRAEEAVETLRGMLVQANTIADLSTAMGAMEEIKRLQRMKAWESLPDRYATLRRTLSSIRSANRSFPDDYKDALSGTAKQLGIIEAQIERALASKNNTLDPAKLNRIVSAQMDKLEEILTTTRLKIGD